MVKFVPMPTDSVWMALGMWRYPRHEFLMEAFVLKSLSFSSLFLLAGCAAKNATPEAAPEAASEVPEAEASAATPADASGFTHVGDIQWTTIYPDQPNSPKMTVLAGNPREGAFSAMVLIPAGYTSKLRYHPASVQAVMIAGTLKNGRTAEDAVEINAGDMWTQPGGEAHVTGCTEEADCIFVGRMDGAMGPVEVEEPVEASTQTVIAAADLELQPLNPEQPDGPRIKVLNGDMTSGPWSGIALLPGGRPAGKRTHGSDYGAAVISGTASGDDVEFGAGSIWREKAGSVHATGCASEDDCVFFISMDGPLKITPVE